MNKVFTYLNFKKEVQLFKDISGAGDLVYGYSRVLRSDYLPITENKVQKNYLAVYR